MQNVGSERVVSIEVGSNNAQKFKPLMDSRHLVINQVHRVVPHKVISTNLGGKEHPQRKSQQRRSVFCHPG